MKKEIIGILICTLLISVAVAPVVNALTIEKNEINEISESNLIVNYNIKLNTSQSTSGFPFQIIYIGLISNKSGGGGAYYKFKCVNVIEFAWDDTACYFNHYTNGEKVWIPVWHSGILTNHFVFAHFELC